MLFEKLKNNTIQLREYYFSFGLHFILSFIVMKVLAKIGILSDVELLRIKSSKYAMIIFSNTVRYGPFKGMVFSEDVWWGRNDFPLKMVGQYEEHVLREIISNSKNYKIFIDIGAADGYYAVGLLKANIFKSAYCFEISLDGRRVIYQNAKINKVLDRVTIKSKANCSEIIYAIQEHGTALILCDIEGGEYTLFDNYFLSKLSKCMLIIELHDQNTENGSEHWMSFIENASNYFKVDFISRSNPSVHCFNEFNDLPDNQKMLMFSEGRPSVMKWIKLSPK